MSNLKSCPFCGAEAWMHTYGGIFNNGGGVGYRIECEGSCHSMTCYWHTENEAIKTWNNRAPEDK